MIPTPGPFGIISTQCPWGRRSLSTLSRPLYLPWGSVGPACTLRGSDSWAVSFSLVNRHLQPCWVRLCEAGCQAPLLVWERWGVISPGVQVRAVAGTRVCGPAQLHQWGCVKDLTPLRCPCSSSKPFPCLAPLSCPHPELPMLFSLLLLFFPVFSESFLCWLGPIYHLFTFCVIFFIFCYRTCVLGWGLWFLAQKLSKLRLLSQNSNSPQTRGGVGVGRDACSAISRHSTHCQPLCCISAGFRAGWLSSSKQSRGQLSNTWVALSWGHLN